MTPATGFRYIVQSQSCLSAWPQWRSPRVETTRTVAPLAAFIFEDTLFRRDPIYTGYPHGGAVEKIMTDNGTAYIIALVLARRSLWYCAHSFESAYNSIPVQMGLSNTTHDSGIHYQGMRRQHLEVARYDPPCVLGRPTTRKSTATSPSMLN